MDFVEVSRSKMRILQGELRHKATKWLAAGRANSVPLGYISIAGFLEKINKKPKNRSFFY